MGLLQADNKIDIDLHAVMQLTDTENLYRYRTL